MRKKIGNFLGKSLSRIVKYFLIRWQKPRFALGIRDYYLGAYHGYYEVAFDMPKKSIVKSYKKYANKIPKSYDAGYLFGSILSKFVKGLVYVTGRKGIGKYVQNLISESHESFHEEYYKDGFRDEYHKRWTKR